MGELIKCTKQTCAKCQYRMLFGVSPGHQRVSYNFCCNYLNITGHSRIFKDGVPQFDAKYCDKYEEGKVLTGATWEDTSRRNLIGSIEKFYTRNGRLHVNDYYSEPDLGGDQNRDV